MAEKTISKTEKVAEVMFKYVIPVIGFVSGIAVTWALMGNSVTQNANAIEVLQEKYEQSQDTVNTIKQNLVEINTKLEYIQKALDK